MNAPWAHTRDNYDRLAERYADFAGERYRTDPLSRAMVQALAEQVSNTGGGPILDAGCGPGHISAHLQELGAHPFGVDLSPRLVTLARSTHPGLRFVVGALQGLPVREHSVAGVVANYAIIHTPPKQLPEIAAELARVLTDGGVALVSFQALDAPGRIAEPFDHAVTRAYRYAPDHVCEVLAEVGVVETSRLVSAAEQDPVRGFPQAYLLARKDRPRRDQRGGEEEQMCA